MGTLYIVATPIGNLQDISFRALKTLEEVDFIACEDTRKTSILLKHFFKDRKDMLSKLFSFYEQKEFEKTPEIVNLLINNKNIALVSDAGTPTISDPGYKLVRECLSNNIKVISVPGASSVVSGLVSSGLPTDKFTFLGFLPQKPGHRITFLENVKKSQQFLETTIIFFESPYKIKKTLLDMLNIFGDIEIVIEKELTKMFENRSKNKISEFIKLFETSNPRGEYIILFSLKT